MIRRLLCCFISICFLPFPNVQGQDIVLPVPGTRVHLTPAFNPPILKGIKVYPDDPFKLDFVLSQGDTAAQAQADYLKEESTRLIKYFLAALTTPEQDIWVNLSPYEKDRIVPESFGHTQMGRDLLAQDYLLKQVTASLIYPEDAVGKKFWHKVYETAKHKYGNSNMQIKTFNKVWIVPDKAVIYENLETKTAYVVESTLKVLTEEDYFAGSINKNTSSYNQIVKDIVIPQLTKEINEGENFTKLRQVYHSLILATWYKKRMKDSILSAVYADQNKIAGVNIEDPQEKQRIYERYLEAFKKGAFNYIKETEDPITKHLVPKKYFSGGVTFNVSRAMVTSKTMPVDNAASYLLSVNITKANSKIVDRAQLVKIVNNAQIDFDPKNQDLSIDGVNLKRIEHVDPHTLVYYYGEDYVFKISLDPDEEIVDVFEKGISPKIYQTGFIVKGGTTYQYYVQDRIEGYSLDRITSELQQPDVFDYDFSHKQDRQQRSLMVVDLIQKLINHRLMLEDWGDRQFMLGRIAGDKSQPIRAWLIDTDLLTHQDKTLSDMTQQYIALLQEMPLNEIVVDNQLIIDVLLNKPNAVLTNNAHVNLPQESFSKKSLMTLGGANILYSLDTEEIHKIIDSPEDFFIQGEKQATHLQRGKRRWLDNDKDLEFLDNIFDIVSKIKALSKEKPNKEIVILDWGCGEGSGIIALKNLLESQGVKIKVYGLSHDYYPKWQMAPAGVNFILDSGENLLNYFDKGSIDFIVSTSGLAHLFTSFDSFNRGKIKNTDAYFRGLIDLLTSGGLLLIDAHRYQRPGTKFTQASITFDVMKSPSDLNNYFQYKKEDNAMTSVQFWQQDLDKKIDSTRSQINATLEFEKQLELLHAEMTTLNYAHLKNYIEKLRNFYRLMTINAPSTTPQRTHEEYAASLEKLKKQRNQLESRIKKANQAGDYKEIRTLSLQLLRYNRTILKLQILVAGSSLNQINASNFEFKRSSILATLKGAEHSAQNLHDELRFRLLRLSAREKIYSIKYGKDFNEVRHFIESTDFSKGPQKPVLMAQEVYINVHSRIDAIKAHLHKNRLRDALKGVDFLMHLYDQQRLQVSGNYKDIYESLKILKRWIISEQQSLFPIMVDLENIDAMIEGIKNKMVKYKVAVRTGRQYSDLGAAYRSFLHSLDGYEEELALILKYKATLDYYTVILKRSLNDASHAISIEKRTMILEGLKDALDWVKRGFVDPKQIAEINLGLAVDQFQLQDIKGTLDQINQATIRLQQRVDAIAGKGKSWGMMQSVQAKLTRFYKEHAGMNHAMTAQDVDRKTGGIDFNAQRMNLQTNSPEGQIRFDISPEIIEQWRQAPGIIPVIIKIAPLNSLSTFLNGSLNALQDA